MNAIQPSKVLIVLLASCLFWIGGISLAVMWFAGTSVTTSWILAGALLLALSVWLVVMSHEIRNAIELPVFFATAEPEDTAATASPDFQFKIRGVPINSFRSGRPVMKDRKSPLTPALLAENHQTYSANPPTNVDFSTPP